MKKEPVIKFSIKKYKEIWNPVFKDDKRWLLGFYKPQAKSLKEIDYLEKHKYPELFLLIEGKIILVIKEKKDSPIKKLALKKGEVVIINCWHNGYALEPDSTALVIESSDNPTQYIENVR